MKILATGAVVGSLLFIARGPSVDFVPSTTGPLKADILLE